jgi:GNAT superfamily N-acetyltransferase
MVAEPLTPSYYAQAAAILSRAFEADPTWRYVFTSATRRLAQLECMCHVGLRLIAPLGASYITRQGEGVALWYPPDHEPKAGLIDLLRVGFAWMPFRLGIRSLRRGWRVYADILRREREEIAGPYWVLDTIGVDPPHQKRGVARALMRPVLERADRDRIPCYVITHNPINVPFYEHHGFRVIRRDTVFPGGPFVCSLRRTAPTA